MIRFRFCFCPRFGGWGRRVHGAGYDIDAMTAQETRIDTQSCVCARGHVLIRVSRKTPQSGCKRVTDAVALSHARTRAGCAAGAVKTPRDAQKAPDRIPDQGRTLSRVWGFICNAWTCRTGRRTAAEAAGRYNTCDHLQCYCIISARGCQGYLCGFRRISAAANRANTIGNDAR